MIHVDDVTDWTYRVIGTWPTPPSRIEVGAELFAALRDTMIPPLLPALPEQSYTLLGIPLVKNDELAPMGWRVTYGRTEPEEHTCNEWCF